MLKDLDHLLRPALAGQARFEEPVAAGRAISVEGDKFRDQRVRRPTRDSRGNTLSGRVFVQRMTDRNDWRAMAAAHARCPHNADIIAEAAIEISQELRRAGELAAKAVADADRDRRWRRLFIHHDVKMGVE